MKKQSMNQPKINLLDYYYQPKHKKPFFKIGKFFTIAIIFFILLIGTLSYNIIFSKETSSNNLPFFSLLGNKIKSLRQSKDNRLKGWLNDRINVLILGIGGVDHQGSNLTDTIILASYQPSTKKVALLSIPRDLAVPIPGYGWKKINHINAYAEAKKPGSGGYVVSNSLEKIFGEPIHYFIRVDFQGFINVINLLGGVDVYVDRSFDDYHYPVLGKEYSYPIKDRWEHLHFEKGWKHMDGSLALKYARSRHGTNGEGSDFARARRQQKIILAAKNKFFSINTLLHPKLISELYNESRKHFSTNISLSDVWQFYNISKQIDKNKIIFKVLDTSKDGLLIATRGEDNAFLLLPRTGNFKQIKDLIHNIFNQETYATKLQKEKQMKNIRNEKAKIIVLNSTKVEGLAAKFSQRLINKGYFVEKIANAKKHNYQKTVIYNLNPDKKMPFTLTGLIKEAKANLSPTIPEWIALYKNKANFVIVLGKDIIK